MAKRFEGCHVCLEEKFRKNNKLFTCSGRKCQLRAHQACYGIRLGPNGEWTCQTCQDSWPPKSVSCRMCPLVGGAIKRKRKNTGWCHIVCALYIKQVSFENNELREEISFANVPEHINQNECYICTDEGKCKICADYGVRITCISRECTKSVHVTCAQLRGLLVEYVYDRKSYYVGFCDEHLPEHNKRNRSSDLRKSIEKTLYSDQICSEWNSDEPSCVTNQLILKVKTKRSSTVLTEYSTKKIKASKKLIDQSKEPNCSLKDKTSVSNSKLHSNISISSNVVQAIVDNKSALPETGQQPTTTVIQNVEVQKADSSYEAILESLPTKGKEKYIEEWLNTVR